MSRVHPSGQSGPREEPGCLPCGNCFVVVPQDRFFALERFGKFDRTLAPGLSWAGFDLCGACVAFRSISSRVVQSFIRISTKTKDNVFVYVMVAVQHTVTAEGAQDALYKLEDVSEQLDSYVADVVRSFVPSLSLDECFERKEEISVAVEEKLKTEMIQFGLTILKALVTDIQPDHSVVASMNEINKQKRLRDASQMAAEAHQIKVVRAAEASADAAQLAGEGIARQRRAIIDGIRESITFGSEETLSANSVSHLLLVTQYYETLRDISSGSKSSTVFLDSSVSAIADLVAQIRRGMVESNGGSTASKKPMQQDMLISELEKIAKEG